jgi:hypothetical protein
MDNQDPGIEITLDLVEDAVRFDPGRTQEELFHWKTPFETFPFFNELLKSGKIYSKPNDRYLESFYPNICTKTHQNTTG